MIEEKLKVDRDRLEDMLEDGKSTSKLNFNVLLPS